ncbi:hypothetical protein AO370_1499 [Moraxella catarrhalis]|uniref:Uncharacterized protein n=1 Tax=Moraxella catarrhalis TaxID=480 RepID=A0AB36DMJ5_MORCA|nr:hypothetical protein AO370_1499 [Moraxella catarrhalis]
MVIFMNDPTIISTQPKTGFINPFTDYGFKKSLVKKPVK